MSVLIELKNLEKRYENDGVVTSAINGIDLTIREGEFVALMGPSGSGKSTLMHVLGFLDRLTGGTYTFRNKDVSRLEADELAHMRRTEVGFVFQAFHLLPNSTVLDNVVLPMVYAQVPLGERKVRAQAALEAVGLSHRLNHLSNQLSGGERQRVAIARAIVNNPKVLFADEPTGNLDTASGTAVLHLLQTMYGQGRTIIMVTHESEAAEYAERIVRVRDGKIISDTKDHTQRHGDYIK